MSFTLTSITATGSFPTFDSTGKVPSTSPILLWAPDLAPEDGPTGSKYPITFLSPPSTALTDIISLSVSGSFTFPPDWQQKTYLVTAELPTSGGPVFQSNPLPVPPSPTTQVFVPVVRLVQPNIGTAAAPLPFRWAGDFVWSIALETTPAIKIAAPTPTRLELCWVKSGPPAGPQDVHVNFEGAYPIGLFRMFLPSPSEIASIPKGKAPNDWYVQRSMNRIWNWSGNKDVPVRVPFRYDVVGGIANFGVGAFGGSFRLKRFLDNMFYNVNCYDLAALAQLACSILLDWDGTEVLMSSWVFQQPCGYINSGQLFGWPEYPDCNNPFWGSNQQGISTDPVVPGNEWLPLGPPRANFKNHAWVEVTMSNSSIGVLDATHGLKTPPAGISPNSPADGSQDRQHYLVAQIDQTPTLQPEKGNWVNNTLQGSGGSCYQSPIWQVNPWIRVRNITVNSFTIPHFSRMADGTIAMPEPMGREIARTIERCQVPSKPLAQYSNVALQGEQFHTLLETFHPELSAEVHEYLISSGGVEVLASLDDQTTRTFLEISVFDQFEVAFDYLTHLLISFNTSHDAVQPRNDCYLGAYTFHMAGQIVWLRGNVIVRIFCAAKDPKAGGLTDMHRELGRYIDEYIARDAVDKPELKRPAPVLVGQSQVRVKMGETIAVKLHADDTTLDEKTAQIEHPLLLWLGPSEHDVNTFEFLGLEEGNTEVKLNVAAKSNLSVGTVKVHVEVVA
ncbi:hypothetical protein BDD12DRAFT_808187 [Trichophaea hybrida]|nr:hypothetical protein BDD12DRAFT_808187 [Trichophaea hybrida]